MSERKLASIQRIVSLSPIEGADKIEKAVVLGWELVVAKKDSFKVGDKVCYCEIDSILPDKPEFEFLIDRKFRIKTIKLKGQVSQGICFPLSILPKGNYKEGDDVTNLIGVRKYNPQAEFEHKEADRLAAIDKNRLTKFFKRLAWYRRLFFKPKRVPFPAFIKKTDEDRIQLFPDYYERWGDLTFDVTEKVDGQSVTYFMIPNKKIFPWDKKWKFGVCSRNFQLLKPDNSSYWTLAKELDIEKKMTVWCDDHNSGLIIQGEAVGLGIQGNKYKLDKIELFVFNVTAYKNGQKFNYNQTDQFNFCYDNELKPVYWLGSATRLKPTIPEMVESAKGCSMLNPNFPREGIVVRNYGEHVSFKVINIDFLLKYGE